VRSDQLLSYYLTDLSSVLDNAAPRRLSDSPSRAYALRVPLSHARVCDGLVQSIQTSRARPHARPKQSRSNPPRARLPAQIPSGRTSSPTMPTASAGTLRPPMCHSLRLGRHRATSCCGAMLSCLRTYTPLMSIPACPLVQCKPRKKLEQVHIQGGSREQLETFYTAMFHTLQAFSLCVAVGLIYLPLYSAQSSTHMNKTMTVSTRGKMTRFKGTSHILATRSG
jgi:hypothetical protein